MPNKRDVIKVHDIHTAKKHLLMTKKEAFMMMMSIPLSPQLHNIQKSILCHIKKMNMNARRVCVCMKCFNIEEKLRPLSAAS